MAAWWAARTDQEKLDDVPGPLRDVVRQGAEKTTEPADVAKVQSHWMRKVWAKKPERLAAAVAAVDTNDAATTALRKEIPKTFVFHDLHHFFACSNLAGQLDKAPTATLPYAKQQVCERVPVTITKIDKCWVRRNRERRFI